MQRKVSLSHTKCFPGIPRNNIVTAHSLEVQVSDVAQLDDVGPQAVDLPVRLPVVLHLRSQVILEMDFALVYLPETALQLLVIYQKANKGR